MMAKKKICYICYRRFPDTNFEHYSKAVSDNGYEVTVLTFLDTGQKEFEILDGRKIYRIPRPSNRGKRSRMFTFTLQIVKFLNKHKFSIVHIHHTCAYFGLIRMFTTNGAKFVYHTTSYPISNTRLQALKKMIIIFIQCLLMDKIIVQSKELKEKLIGIHNLKRTQVVPVGFNRNLFFPIGEDKKRRLRSSLNIYRNHPALVYCGSISKFRRLDQLIEAFKKVCQLYEEAKLIMIGDGDAPEEINALARSLGIEKNIVFMGRIPHDKVGKYIAMADIGISYVPINENYNYNPPLKTFEYLACGLPTIATRTVSNCKIIKDGFNGILVDDTPEDVAMFIINLLRDKNKQAFLRKNARESIMAFDFEYITRSSLVPLYESLLGVN